MLRLFRRALARANVPVRFTEGFNPHPRISLPLPRPVGMASDAEVLVIETVSDIDPDGTLVRLATQTPDDLHMVSVRRRESKAAMQPTSVTYRLDVEGLPAPDGFVVETAFQAQTFPFSASATMSLFDESGDVLADDSLPLSPPNLSFFSDDAGDSNSFVVDGLFAEEEFYLSGSLTQFTPEPGSLILLGAAFGLVLRRRFLRR